MPRYIAHIRAVVQTRVIIKMSEKLLSFHKLFSVLDKEILRKNKDKDTVHGNAQTSIERHMGGFQTIENMNGIKRIQLCRQALDALDRRGWNRSFHQRMFHEEYLKSCTRVFFKRDGPGAFARAHSRVLEVNSWDSTPQEILVSTPRYTLYVLLNDLPNMSDDRCL